MKKLVTVFAFTATQAGIAANIATARPDAVGWGVAFIALPFYAWLFSEGRAAEESTTIPVMQGGRLINAQTAESLHVARSNGCYRYTVSRGGNKSIIVFPPGITPNVIARFVSIVYEAKPYKPTQAKLCGEGKPFQNNDKDFAQNIKPPLPAWLTWITKEQERFGVTWYDGDTMTREFRLAARAWTALPKKQEPPKKDITQQ